MRQYGRADVDYATWYSDWSRRLARRHTRSELERMLGRASGEAGRAAESHLRAVGASTSMSSQAMRRAHARNTVRAAGEEAMAIRGALEIHELFPEHAKGAKDA